MHSIYGREEITIVLNIPLEVQSGGTLIFSPEMRPHGSCTLPPSAAATRVAFNPTPGHSSAVG